MSVTSKKMSFSLFAGGISLFVVGCATLIAEPTLEPGAEKIRLFMTEQRDCKFISEVHGNYEAQVENEDTDEKARILLKNEALSKKANAVVIISIDRKKDNEMESKVYPAYTKIFGNAYVCRNLESK